MNTAIRSLGITILAFVGLGTLLGLIVGLQTLCEMYPAVGMSLTAALVFVCVYTAVYVGMSIMEDNK